MWDGASFMWLVHRNQKKVLNETVESILATEWLKTPQQAFSFSQM